MGIKGVRDYYVKESELLSLLIEVPSILLYILESPGGVISTHIRDERFILMLNRFSRADQTADNTLASVRSHRM